MLFKTLHLLQNSVITYFILINLFKLILNYLVFDYSFIIFRIYEHCILNYF